MTVPFWPALEREFARSGTRCRVFTDQTAALTWVEELRSQHDDVGVTWARALIAESGSVVLCGEGGQRRRDSLLCRHHLALVRCRDIHRDLECFLATLPGEQLHQVVGSHLTLISGPSRTADIEKVLVVPAHGPEKLTVVIVDATCDPGAGCRAG
ncbi:MAG: LUD domain-containing protein [Deltaproteobacteria bacterium]|nr:LUD domain-containing protein [Deltaproteobacteria bacterium]